MIAIRMLSIYIGIVTFFFVYALSLGLSKTKSRIVVVLASPILLLSSKGRETLRKGFKK